MTKKLGKSEKLDRILSELSVLRADIKSLLQEGSRGTKAGATARARPAPAKKAAKRAQPARKSAKAPARRAAKSHAKPKTTASKATRARAAGKRR